MSAFALYRLPHADHYVRLEGTSRQLLSCNQLNGVSGFVVAPFEVRPDQPIVVISPDAVWNEELRVKNEESTALALPFETAVANSSLRDASFSNYAIDFANFHAQLRLGVFRKIVLARCVREPLPAGTSPEQLFLRACQLYPRMFVALVYTPQSGMWLTATPEILLQGHGHDWRTIALAGTMRLEGEQLSGEGENVTWSTKNIEEQRIVATYIAECLEQFSSDFREEGPRTVRAANLVHLRSDFIFKLPDTDRLGSLLYALHPTPAVCGLPKREAFRFITRNEHTPRCYYSGFVGMLDPQADTHLYVALRCMSIGADHCRLYAGGGLLKDSQLEQEWQETEAKLETMRRLIC